MKEITFYIDNVAYTIDIGADADNVLENSIKDFLSTDESLTTKDVLLAYLRRTEEVVQYKRKLRSIIHTIPTLEQFKQKEEEKDKFEEENKA